MDAVILPLVHPVLEIHDGVVDAFDLDLVAVMARKMVIKPSRNPSLAFTTLSCAASSFGMGTGPYFG